MDIDKITEIQNAIRVQSGSGLVRALSETIVEKPLTVRFAKDRLSAVLNRARNGEPQCIGADPAEQTVIISMADLAQLCEASAGTLSFGDVMRRAGIRSEPTPESRPLEIEQRPRQPQDLSVYREQDQPGVSADLAPVRPSDEDVWQAMENMRQQGRVDFDPVEVVNQIPALRRLYEGRQRLRDLMAKLDRDDDLTAMLNQIIVDPSDREALQPGARLSEEEAQQTAGNLRKHVGLSGLASSARKSSRRRG